MPAKNSRDRYPFYTGLDTAFIIISFIFCFLVWAEYFSGGYKAGLTGYNVFIARVWALLAVFTAIYSVVTVKSAGSPRGTGIILLVYSLLTIILVFLVIIIGL